MIGDQTPFPASKAKKKAVFRHQNIIFKTASFLRKMQFKSVDNLITYGAGITSFKPFEYTSKMEMMLAFGDDFWVISIILCMERRGKEFDYSCIVLIELSQRHLYLLDRLDTPLQL